MDNPVFPMRAGDPRCSDGWREDGSAMEHRELVRRSARRDPVAGAPGGGLVFFRCPRRGCGSRSVRFLERAWMVAMVSTRDRERLHFASSFFGGVCGDDGFVRALLSDAARGPGVRRAPSGDPLDLSRRDAGRVSTPTPPLAAVSDGQRQRPRCHSESGGEHRRKVTKTIVLVCA